MSEGQDTALVPGGAGELVAQGATLMRIENESMLAVAVQRPRNESKIVEGALKELELVPEEAAVAFYTIPYRDRKADGSTKIVNVTGPSIKAAMALGRRWGNCTTGCRALKEDAAGWDLEGVFIDLESNFRVARPQRVNKFYRTRKGDVVALQPDRQILAFQAGASKAIRNAILAGLPAYLVSAYDKKARALAGGKLDAVASEQTVKAVVSAFGKWGVTEDQLVKYQELPTNAWTGSDIADLRGLWNAINDGQIQADEAFSDGGQESQATPKGSALETLTETLTDSSISGPFSAGAISEPATPVAEPAAAEGQDDRGAERARLVAGINELFESIKFKPLVKEHLLKKHLDDKDYGSASLLSLAGLHNELTTTWENIKKARGK